MSNVPVAAVQSALDHIWVHAAQYADLAQDDGLKVFVQGEGCTLVDLRGRSFLDAMAGLAIVNAGHGRVEIAQAMADQACRLAYVSSFNHVADVTVRLAEALSRRLPAGLDRIFFCSGGSEAVEAALKIARQYHVLRGQPQRQKFIGRIESYHGATYGAMAVSGRSRAWLNRFFGPFAPEARFAPQPDLDPGADALEDLIRFEGPDTIAAIIAEPVSFSAGIVVPPAGYWRRLREICDRYGALLIADEVITGFGRTGRWFGLDHWGVVPDLLTLAKGFSSGYAPLGACVARREVAEVFVGDAAHTLRHGYSYGGHAVAAAAGLKNLEILEREDLPGNAARQGERLLAGLQALGHHPSVGAVRGLGLMCAIDLMLDKTAARRATLAEAHVLDHRLMQGGLLTRCWETLFFAPPLCITPEEVDRLLEITDHALYQFEDELGIA